MVAQSERQFAIFNRDQIRDEIILPAFRNYLRDQINPETGALFTEDEITQATQVGSTFWIEADSIDLVGQAEQARALFFGDQIRPKRANTAFLEDYHARRWLGEDARLAATGGSGSVSAQANIGAIFPGSTVIGDPTAAVAVDNAGNRYQVLTTTTVVSSPVTLALKGVDTGSDTNPAQNDILTWSVNQPASAIPEVTVLSDFSGGFDEETDDELADRVEERIRNKPASGNSAHFASWAQEASSAIEKGFVYSCPFYAGSVMVCLVSKRTAGNTSPTNRINSSIGTVIDAVSYLTPPLSPVVPQHVHVVVVEPNSQESDLVMRIAMGTGTNGGWADSTPWPNPLDTSSYLASEITSIVTPQQVFEIDTDSALPGGAALLSGANAPSLMVWDSENSEFVVLDVSSVSHAGTTATVTLSAPLTGSFTLATGQRVSPYTDQYTVIQESARDYFDELGPGEIVDLTTDTRGSRAFRYPEPTKQYPYRAGQLIVSRMIDAMSGITTDITLTEISKSEPDLPGDIIDGPNMLSLGDFVVYPL